MNNSFFVRQFRNDNFKSFKKFKKNNSVIIKLLKLRLTTYVVSLKVFIIYILKNRFLNPFTKSNYMPIILFLISKHLIFSFINFPNSKNFNKFFDLSFSKKQIFSLISFFFGVNLSSLAKMKTKPLIASFIMNMKKSYKNYNKKVITKNNYNSFIQSISTSIIYY